MGDAIAWQVTLPGRSFSYFASDYKKAKFCHSEEPGSEIIPLCRFPALTEEEREAIIDARCAFLNDAAEADELADQEWWASKRRQQAASLQSLLDRLG